MLLIHLKQAIILRTWYLKKKCYLRLPNLLLAMGVHVDGNFFFFNLFHNHVVMVVSQSNQVCLVSL